MSKHVDAFASRLGEDESLVASCPGHIDGAPYWGALMVTNKRVIFYRKGFFGEFERVVQRDRVAGVTFKTGSTKGTVCLEGPAPLKFFAHSQKGFADIRRALS